MPPGNGRANPGIQICDFSIANPKRSYITVVEVPTEDADDRKVWRRKIGCGDP